MCIECCVKSLRRESHRRLLSQNGYGKTFLIININIIISEGAESTIWAYTRRTDDANENNKREKRHATETTPHVCSVARAAL